MRFRSGAGRSFLELDGELLEGDLDGRPLTQQGNRLWLDLEEGEHTATVTARCHTTSTGEGLVRSVDPADGAVYVYGQSFLDDAQRIFACFDQPDLKATFALTVDAPDGWVVRGNTRAVVSERGHHEFEPTERMPPYLFSVAGGPWHGRTARHGDLELGVWCRASLEPHFEADEILHVTGAVPGLPAAALRPADALRHVLRPGVRPRLQRRGDGERRPGHLRRRVLRPAEPVDRAASAGCAPRSSPTSWRTCGSATW